MDSQALSLLTMLAWHELHCITVLPSETEPLSPCPFPWQYKVLHLPAPS
jgi:hypothetical protein